MILALAVSLALAADRPDIVVEDFEKPTYAGWDASGEAFGPGPAQGALAGQMPVSGFEGKGLVNSFFSGDKSVGALRSSPVRIERKFVVFLIGGGAHPGETSFNLLVDGKAVRSATGPNSEHLRRRFWDVAELEGKTVQLEILDRHTGGWGHLNLDAIVLSDTKPEFRDDREGALKKAAESIARAAERAAKDPARPVYHFRSPGNWINDPNGPIFYKGWHHLFYQHNPYGDDWGNMHWGHARSRDLVRWEHLPVALWPSVELGEEHVFSGSATIGPDGKPWIFYTSIGPRDPEQWAAIPEDDDLIVWKKHPQNPLLSFVHHGDLRIDDWRDPFVIKEGGKWLAAVGGHPAGKKGAVMLYESENLSQWKFRGVAHQGTEANWECPNFFKRGEKWVLAYSPHGIVRWKTGALDLAAAKFTPSLEGTMDHGQAYYAPIGCADSNGRWIEWGWVRGFPAGRAWNGCMTLPREITLDATGRVVQAPAAEVASLRASTRYFPRREMQDGAWEIDGVAADGIEIEIAAKPEGGARLELRLRRPKEGAPLVVQISADEIRGGKEAIPLKQLGLAAPTLRLFLDRSVLEIYAAGECLTQVVPYSGDERGLEITASGGEVTIESILIHTIAPVW